MEVLNKKWCIYQFLSTALYQIAVVPQFHLISQPFRILLCGVIDFKTIEVEVSLRLLHVSFRIWLD
jgi:hypothetical protein